MVSQSVHHAQGHVGQRAHGQRGTAVAHLNDQLGILQGAHAVVDALDTEQLDGLPDVVRAALLPRVRDQPQAFGRGVGVDIGEQGGRVADLGGVQADADELLTEGQRRAQRIGGGFGPAVAQEAQDQGGGDPVGGLALGQRGGQPAEHLGQRHAVVEVRLRVEEDLGPAHARGRSPGQVGLGQIVEVLLVPQHRQIGEVQVEEGLQILEPVPGPQLGHVGGRQRDAIAGGQLDQQLGFERAFDVQVKLGNGQHG